MKFISFAIDLIASYVCAAAISSHVSMDLSQTDWLSLWTYFWWAAGIPAMTIIVGAASALVAFAIAGLVRLFE